MQRHSRIALILPIIGLAILLNGATFFVVSLFLKIPLWSAYSFSPQVLFTCIGVGFLLGLITLFLPNKSKVSIWLAAICLIFSLIITIIAAIFFFWILVNLH